MGGYLTIHSSGDGSLLSGHSWIEFRPDQPAGANVTYGTWGNNPAGRGNGLQANIEIGRIGDANRSTYIDDQQEAKLLALIGRYRDQGDEGWSYLHPCSAFAANAWHFATGEALKHRRWGLISNPSTLRDSIAAKGGLVT